MLSRRTHLLLARLGIAFAITAAALATVSAMNGNWPLWSINSFLLVLNIFLVWANYFAASLYEDNRSC